MDHNAAEKQDLVFVRVFDVPVEELWKSWSESDYVMQWWGPNGFSSPLAKMDFREGGSSLICMRAPQEFGGQDTYNTWNYTRIVPKQAIEYTLSFCDPQGKKVDPTALGLPEEMPQDVRHRIAFKPLSDGKTELTVTEFDWPMVPMREMSKMGMEQCLDKIAAIYK